MTFITVQGLPWCKEPKTVGLASLVAKNLCRDHNTALSPADLEAQRYKDAVGELVAGKKLLPIRVALQARLIEQWLLKTTINLALQEPGSGLDLSDALVRRAFRIDPTPTGEGFFAVVAPAEQIGYTPGLRFESMVRKADGRMVMAIFVIHGWRAIYAFDGAPPVRHAFRLREWNSGSHWIRLRWDPDLDEGDTTMPPLR